LFFFFSFLPLWSCSFLAKNLQNSCKLMYLDIVFLGD
jgi:hypothetical protein